MLCSPRASVARSAVSSGSLITDGKRVAQEAPPDRRHVAGRRRRSTTVTRGKTAAAHALGQ